MKKDFIKKVIELQCELNAPKSKHNDFGNFSYRSTEDILGAAKPILLSKGLLLTLTERPLYVDGWHYIECTATLTDGESSISTKASARENPDRAKFDPGQLTGAAITYARKYALGGLLAIDDGQNDPDGQKNPEPGTVQQTPQTVQQTPGTVQNGAPVAQNPPPVAQYTQQAPPEKKNRPWLNRNTEQWYGAIKYLKEGGELKTIRVHYKISNKDAAALKQLVEQPA